MSVRDTLSTMHRCGWLVWAVAALSLACPSASSTSESGPSNPDMEAGPLSKLATTCYFGSPSESCAFTCTEKSMEAYCDEVKKQCACRDPENKKVPDAAQTESDKFVDDSKTNEDTQISSVMDRPVTNFRFKNFCVFGYPSPACILHCNKLSLKSYCDKEQGVCRCSPPPDDGTNMDWLKLLESVTDGDSEESTASPDLLGEHSDSSSGISSELFNLWQQLQSGVFDDVQVPEEDISAPEPPEQNNTLHFVFYIFDFDSLLNETETISTPNTTKFYSTHPALRHIGKTIEGWAFSHVMAIILIFFLLGLLLLELAFCLKREKPDSQMEGIFPTKK